MSEISKASKGAKGKLPVPIVTTTNSTEPGKGAALKPKKAAAHRQVIEDAANFNQQTGSLSSPSASAGVDEYEQGKVHKNKKSSYEDDVNAVKALDGWD
mmetsp:Transcript_3891/g.5362  ORF Transcript_3891/g.5362 Transcript_3891/m.5362 type:complete len:99 (+) Transcript_3891:105-401(+)